MGKRVIISKVICYYTCDTRRCGTYAAKRGETADACDEKLLTHGWTKSRTTDDFYFCPAHSKQEKS